MLWHPNFPCSDLHICHARKCLFVMHGHSYLPWSGMHVTMQWHAYLPCSDMHICHGVACMSPWSDMHICHASGMHVTMQWHTYFPCSGMPICYAVTCIFAMEWHACHHEVTCIFAMKWHACHHAVSKCVCYDRKLRSYEFFVIGPWIKVTFKLSSHFSRKVEQHIVQLNFLRSQLILFRNKLECFCHCQSPSTLSNILGQD